MGEKLRKSLEGVHRERKASRDEGPQMQGRESSKKGGTSCIFCRTIKQGKDCVAVLRRAGFEAQ